MSVGFVYRSVMRILWSVEEIDGDVTRKFTEVPYWYVNCMSGWQEFALLKNQCFRQASPCFQMPKMLSMKRP